MLTGKVQPLCQHLCQPCCRGSTAACPTHEKAKAHCLYNTASQVAAAHLLMLAAHVKGLRGNDILLRRNCRPLLGACHFLFKVLRCCCNLLCAGPQGARCRGGCCCLRCLLLAGGAACMTCTRPIARMDGEHSIAYSYQLIHHAGTHSVAACRNMGLCNVAWGLVIAGEAHQEDGCQLKDLAPLVYPAGMVLVLVVVLQEHAASRGTAPLAAPSLPQAV